MTADLYELIDLAAGWRMPIRVHWINPANAEVTVAEVPLLKIQRQAVESKLSANASHHHGPKWFIAIRALEAIAVKSKETDPEQIVIWRQIETDSAVNADFVNAYCASRYATVRAPETFAVVWNSIQTFMLQWLVDQGRPVEFAFGRLDAFPVRPNWKNAMIGRIFKNRLYQSHYTAAQFEFFRTCILRNSEMLTAFDLTTNTMRWSVEFTPNKQFHAAARVRETKRKLNHRWENNYLGQILKALREPAVFERLYENIVAYAKETNYPFAVFPDGCRIRRPPKGFQPTHGTMAWYQTPAVTHSAILEQAGSALVPEDASVPSVSDLQSPAQDVRDAGDEVAAAGEGDA